MYIDDCQHSFEHLVTHVLPGHMERLNHALQSPWPASTFAKPRIGPKALATTLGLVGDFSGCYVVLDSVRPIYVGISRKVVSRLRQHMFGRTHFDASLAYRMAQRHLPTKGQRTANMEKPEFRVAFADAQKQLRSYHVAAVPIDNSLELHVFEPYAAMTLKTSDWNTFRTH